MVEVDGNSDDWELVEGRDVTESDGEGRDSYWKCG